MMLQCFATCLVNQCYLVQVTTSDGIVQFRAFTLAQFNYVLKTVIDIFEHFKWPYTKMPLPNIEHFPWQTPGIVIGTGIVAGHFGLGSFATGIVQQQNKISDIKVTSCPNFSKTDLAEFCGCSPDDLDQQYVDAFSPFWDRHYKAYLGVTEETALKIAKFAKLYNFVPADEETTDLFATVQEGVVHV